MLLRLVVLALSLLCSSSAFAACVSFGISATGLDFGVYDPASNAPTPTTGTITTHCLVGLLPDFQVTLTKGTGTFSQRTMTQGTNVLNYNLYIDSNHMMVWGDGTAGTSVDSFSALIALGSQDFTVYGLADKHQYPAPGGYADTITATVNF